jgi:hypothetical protein
LNALQRGHSYPDPGRCGRRGHQGYIQYVNQDGVGYYDAAGFISGFYEERRIRIHTIAVGSEDGIRKFNQGRYAEDMAKQEAKRVLIPRPAVLNQIAQLTAGRFFTAANAGGLHELFEEWSEATIINVSDNL